MSVNSKLDNISVGNIAAHVDIATGKTAGPGIYVDITKQHEYKHPVTGIELISFQIPLWKECLALVTGQLYGFRKITPSYGM